MYSYRNEDLDEYVEGRFMFTEQLERLTKPKLIQLINKMLNDGDAKRLWISDEEVFELLDNGKGEEND